jgi:hypothetical protein
MPAERYAFWIAPAVRAVVARTRVPVAMAGTADAAPAAPSQPAAPIVAMYSMP